MVQWDLINTGKSTSGNRAPFLMFKRSGIKTPLHITGFRFRSSPERNIRANRPYVNRGNVAYHASDTFPGTQHTLHYGRDSRNSPRTQPHFWTPNEDAMRENVPRDTIRELERRLQDAYNSFILGSIVNKQHDNAARDRAVLNRQGGAGRPAHVYALPRTLRNTQARLTALRGNRNVHTHLRGSFVTSTSPSLQEFKGLTEHRNKLAATKVQKMFRGYKGRKKAQSERRRRVAATKVQRMYRAYKLRKAKKTYGTTSFGRFSASNMYTQKALSNALNRLSKTKK
jgi:hypothetical protein